MERIYKHYFDLDIMPNLKNEIFADIGAYTGDSILDFIFTYGENAYKKIYCYEMSENNMKLAMNNLKIYKDIVYKQNAVVEKNKKLFYDECIDSSATKLGDGNKCVLGVSLDEDIREKLTLIKMDIEGGEKNALLGAEKHLKENKPKLLISVYHNNTDLFELPKLIKNFNKTYKMHLRYYGGPIFPTEIVLICK